MWTKNYAGNMPPGSCNSGKHFLVNISERLQAEQTAANA
jgi:hypothetical protein